MNLHLAQRLSLIQRNLEAAQLAHDNAVELLNTIIDEIELDEKPMLAAKKERSIPAAPVKTVQAKKRRGKKSVETPKNKPAEEDLLDQADLDALVPAPKKANGIAAAVREFIKEHTGKFTADDLVKWGKEHGYFFSRGQYAANLSWMSGRGNGKYGVGKTEKHGVFIPAA